MESGERITGNGKKVGRLIGEVSALRDRMKELEREFIHSGPVSPAYLRSRTNLLHYLAMRRHDIRPLQEELASLGLSSLGRAEAHVLASVDAVLSVLRRMAGLPAGSEAPEVSFEDGRGLLERHTEALLGPKPGHRRVRMMVTVPSEAADDYLLVRELLDHGMDCMRINCAHDDAASWERMIENLRRAKRELGKKCRVLMDIAGPKLRTGPVEPGARVVRWRPSRDLYGRVTAPARIWLTGVKNPAVPDAPADAAIPVPQGWLSRLKPGDAVELVDVRGRRRRLRIAAKGSGGVWAESERTAYIVPGTELRLLRSGTTGKKAVARLKAKVGNLPDPDPYIRLKIGDILILTRDLVPGRAQRYDEKGRLLSPASIGCTLPEVFSDVRTGERIWFDDGKIGGIVRSASRDQIRVEITQARLQGEKLRGEKGINLPDTRLRLSALTAKDREDLTFIARHAHMVGMSFVQHVADVNALREALEELGAPQVGIVLKIETRRGFEMLPDLILAAMAGDSAGVMIARGDLAVECGYERLAEVQEEILWLCEAAHIPVIWATQVLESLAKTGIPSRAEITDAAMSERAECVMLNKGQYIFVTMRVLDNILQRMEAHQNKKSPLLRQLRWWGRAQSHGGGSTAQREP